MSTNNSACIEGTIHHIGAIEQKSDKFKMRIVVVKTAGQYPQEIAVQFTNANIDKADPLKLGDAVTIHCNIQGREYSGKWYNSLNAWRVELNGNAKPATPIPAIGQNVSTPSATSNSNIVEDLPF